jgi:ABC-type multidrug transport system fused ATPase/permease subunit
MTPGVAVPPIGGSAASGRFVSGPELGIIDLMKFSSYRIFAIALMSAAVLVGVKYLLHYFEWELITMGSLHGSVISGVIFVIGFLLSATIADYKESERIPADIASTLESMSEDAWSIEVNYPKFKAASYQDQLRAIARGYLVDLRSSSRKSVTRAELHNLNKQHAAMENAGVPANFIVKLKQQQAVLLRHLFRVNYIQRIVFVPSTNILAWSIVVLAAGLLLMTEMEPFVAGIVITGAIMFILVYVLQLIRVIRTPFHAEGKTRDDVSLFLLERTVDHLDERQGPKTSKKTRR